MSILPIIMAPVLVAVTAIARQWLRQRFLAKMAKDHGPDVLDKLKSP